jgi:hypothetical protein
MVKRVWAVHNEHEQAEKSNVGASTGLWYCFYGALKRILSFGFDSNLPKWVNGSRSTCSVFGVSCLFGVTAAHNRRDVVADRRCGCFYRSC